MASHWHRVLSESEEGDSPKSSAGKGKTSPFPTPTSCLDWLCVVLQWRLGMEQRPSLPCPHWVPSFSKDELRSPLLQEAFPGCANCNGLSSASACQAHAFSACLSSGKCGGPPDRLGAAREREQASPSRAPLWPCSVRHLSVPGWAAACTSAGRSFTSQRDSVSRGAHPSCAHSRPSLTGSAFLSSLSRYN